MLIRALSLFLICAQMSQAFAMDRFRVIGRGVENRKTGDVIALACVGPVRTGSNPSCGKLQAVKFKADGSAPEWASNYIFDLDHEWELNGAEPTAAHLKIYVRKLNRWVKQFRKDRAGGSEAVSVASLILLGGLGTYAIAEDIRLKNKFPDDPVAGVKTGDFLVWTGIVFGLVFFVNYLVNFPMFPNRGAISEVMADQHGWNWSVRPKKITSKAFGFFEAYLKNLE